MLEVVGGRRKIELWGLDLRKLKGKEIELLSGIVLIYIRKRHATYSLEYCYM